MLIFQKEITAGKNRILARKFLNSKAFFPNLLPRLAVTSLRLFFHQNIIFMSETIKTALITGGSKGIGYGIAEVLINEGIRVAITSRSEDNAQKAAAALNEIKAGYAIGIGSDVRNLESQEKAVSAVLKEWGRLDYFIANAGVGHFAPIQELSAELWQETIDINLTGVFFSAKASLAALTDSQGYFITISSLAGTNFFPNGTAYNASKFGLVGFSQAMMMDVRNAGIKVTTIMPGSVATEFNNHQPSDKDAWKIQPEDIGQIVADLIRMPARTLPSKVEVRPSMPPK
jgi:3-oxoacyl-[acyl-carrier protein] reductase